MQRLYLQFYVTILLVLAIFAGAAALAWQFAEDTDPGHGLLPQSRWAGRCGSTRGQRDRQQR